MIYQYNGKYYIRKGECNHCGECCISSGKEPCPLLKITNGKSFCTIHEQLGGENNREVYDKTGIMTKQCALFPDIGDFMNNAHIRAQCGYYFVETPRVLVACPTHQVKEYCFQEWIDNVKNLTYPFYDILVVDNSADNSYVEKWGKQIPMIHLDGLPQDPEKGGFRICRSMAEIQRLFLAGDYQYWMNIEADNIPPKDVIETLLTYGKGADWTSHCYPVLPHSNKLQQGIGCSLLSRKIIQDFDWSKASDSPDSELWSFAEPIRENQKYKTVELWGIMDVKHLKA